MDWGSQLLSSTSTAEAALLPLELSQVGRGHFQGSPAGSLKVVHRNDSFVSLEGKNLAQSELSGSGFQWFAPFSFSSAATRVSVPTW